MIGNRVTVALVCAGMIVVPVLFESFTFYLYLVGEPSFFMFSGSRLWVFLASELALGFVLGRAFHGSRLYLTAGLIAVVITVLAYSLYHLCDARQCYYAGPDGAGGIRLGTLLFAAASTGLLIGERSKKIDSRPNKNGLETVLFGAVSAVLIGYFPTGLLFATFMAEEIGLFMLGFASTVPFFFSGIVSYLLAGRKMKYAIYSAIAAWAVLSSLFVGIRPSAAPVLLITLAGGVLSALLGMRAAGKGFPRLGEARFSALIFTSMTALFATAAVHPFLDAPMNLSMAPEEGMLAGPTYYSGAYHRSDRYFPTTRVEVGIDISQLGDDIKDFVLAGIGAQSPNCCKDGLDYGYRADILLRGSEIYLVARAWETCDQNIACSGFPWISTMHESEVLLPPLSRSVMLAMEWEQVSKGVNWYYRIESGNWSKYSSFTAPIIENPYFNLGVIWAGIPITNPDTGNAFFFQAGVSVPNESSVSRVVTFVCPAYYDDKGVKHCAEMSPINSGNSHWKVLWKWGVQNESGAVSTHGSQITVELG
ncbi:MAG: hypothetical protein ACREAQ_01080 [Nitrososphaera sp.]